MITEDHVSFETAKLLKEKGFDVYVRSFYEKDKYKTKEEFSTNSVLWNWNISSFRYSAPTLQMAMKWLREVHKIHVVSYPYGDYSCDNYQFDVYKDGITTEDMKFADIQMRGSSQTQNLFGRQ